MRIHTKDEPFKCDVCGRGFCQSGSLKRHMSTHTSMKPYICDIYHQRFSQSGHLKSHIMEYILELRIHLISNIKVRLRFDGQGTKELILLKL